MSHQSELIATDINAYLAQHEQKELLRFLTCGSVDDGKSTLIGRLLHDSKMIYEDHLESIKNDSKKSGNAGEKLDLALLVDGLQAEREQGITIDVAYRYFSTAKRKFIIADTPGHEQYTRNMATGASTCNLAIILIDARNGVKTQTRRHSFLTSLLGIKHIIVAINKMDLMGFSEDVFTKIKEDYTAFAAELGFKDIHFVPISALDGDNVVNLSANTPWYQGQPLMSILETVEISADRNFDDFRFPVQYVNRPNLDFRGFSGTITSGGVRTGDELVVFPSQQRSRVKAIVTYDGELSEAFAGQAVTLTLTDEIDISRGDLLVKPDNLPLVASDIQATVVWMAEAALQAGKQYDIKFLTNKAIATLTRIEYKTDVNTLKQQQGHQLQLNEIAQCHFALNKAVALDNYQANPGTGAFILIDRMTNVTVGAGMVKGIGEQQVKPVSQQERAARFDQQPQIIEITGQERQTAAKHLERRLFNQGRNVVVLDQEALPDTEIESMMSIAEYLQQQGLIVLLVCANPQNSYRVATQQLTVDDVSHLAKTVEELATQL